MNRIEDYRSDRVRIACSSCLWCCNEQAEAMIGKRVARIDAEGDRLTITFDDGSTLMAEREYTPDDSRLSVEIEIRKPTQ